MEIWAKGTPLASPLTVPVDRCRSFITIAGMNLIFNLLFGLNIALVRRQHPRSERTLERSLASPVPLEAPGQPANLALSRTFLRLFCVSKGRTLHTLDSLQVLGQLFSGLQGEKLLLVLDQLANSGEDTSEISWVPTHQKGVFRQW